MKLKRNIKDLQQDMIIEYLLNTDDVFLIEAIKKCPDSDFTGCNNYIMEKAKEALNGKSGYLKDDVVFGFAKEYFIDYEARKEKQDQLEKENKEKALQQRIKDTLVSVKSMITNLKENYNDLYEKHKLTLISYDNELEKGLVKNNDKVDEINRFLATITDTLDVLKQKEFNEKKYVKPEETKKEEKENDKGYKQTTIFDF